MTRSTDSRESTVAVVLKTLRVKLAGEWRMVPVLLALLAMAVIFGLLNPTFLSSRNLSMLSVQIVSLSLLSLGLILVLIVGEIDLSGAFLSAVCATICAQLFVNHDVPIALAIVSGILFGALWGLLQGWIVTKFEIPSFIVTLSGMMFLTGLLHQVLPSDTLEISLSQNQLSRLASTFFGPRDSAVILLACILPFAWLRVRDHGEKKRRGVGASPIKNVVAPVAIALAAGVVAIVAFGAHRGVPAIVIFLIVVISGFAYLANRTKFGKYIYAVGGNAEAAKRAGISVAGTKIKVFMLAGALSGAAGIVAASRLRSVNALSADPLMLLEAIAAAVIGGASLFGGRGSAWAALVGALVMGGVTNGLFLIDASTPVRLICQGTLLIVAIVVDAAISGAKPQGR